MMQLKFFSFDYLKLYIIYPHIIHSDNTIP